jgi:hypothetical protein
LNWPASLKLAMWRRWTDVDISRHIFKISW